MSQRVQVHLVDDLNGEEAQETVRFGLDGTNYEIDLTEKNAESLRTTLSGYVDKGRKAGSAKQTSAGPKSSSRSKREDTQQIRRWAQDNGYNPSSRGRITQSIIDAYNESR